MAIPTIELKANGHSAPIVERPSDRAWYRSSTVYQIYPASFKDHGSAGRGTLKGILQKASYLRDLGVDIVWLSPIFESPQADMGYDISNYQEIDPIYGTLQDWDELRDEVHRLGMKLVMDLVVNHTSDQHEWFKQSRSSKTSPKRDWYIWRDPKYDEHGNRQPSNNWKATFGAESAWEYDETTGQYYLHLFLKEQPDLNWENSEVRTAVYEMMEWWLQRGADGFRMDVINFISKAPGLPDAPTVIPGRYCQPFGNLSINRPPVHGWLKEMNEKVLSRYDCFAVGETPGSDPVSLLAPYSVPENKELQMVFHFHHQSFDRKAGGFSRSWEPDWKLSEVKKIFNTFQVEMEQHGGWNSNYVENHDQPRLVTRMASDHPQDRAKSSKLISMFQCSLGGTLFLYQGQEIGMCNVPWSWGEEEYKDIETILFLEGERAHRGRDVDLSGELKEMRMTARDNGRTPVQWDTSEFAGFSKGTPWMRVHDDYKEGWSVAQQQKDSHSPWKFWQKMLAVRKKYESLIYGKFIPLDEASEEIYAYIRDDPTIDENVLVVLNFARGAEGRGAKVDWKLPSQVDVSKAKLLISNGEEREGSGIAEKKLTLEPWEGRIYLL